MTTLQAMKARAEKVLSASYNVITLDIKHKESAQDVLKLIEALEKCKEHRNNVIEFIHNPSRNDPGGELIMKEEIRLCERELEQILGGSNG